MTSHVLRGNGQSASRTRHLPVIRRCEWISRPPSKRRNRCLPCASTPVTAWPFSRSGQRSRPKRGCGVWIASGILPLEHRPDPVRGVVDRVALRHASEYGPRRDDASPSPHPRRCVSRGSLGRPRTPEQRIACAPLQLRAGLRTHDESRRAASSHVVMRSRELGHVLAAAFLAGEWELGAMAARARRAVGPPGVAANRRARGPGGLSPPAARSPARALGLRRDRARRAGAADAAATRAARAAVSPGDRPRAVAGAADRHDRRARVVPRARARRARVVRRRPRARAGGARRAPAPLPLPAPGARERSAARDRAPEAAAEGAAAAHPARAARLDPGPRRRTRLRPRALGPHARRAATRAGASSSGSISRTSSRASPPRGSTGSSAPPATPRPSRTR